MNLPLNIDIQQIVLHMFNFTILAGGLYVLLYKPVKEFMDNREANYKKMEEDAKAILENAHKEKEAYDAKISRVEEEIQDMKTKALKEVEISTEAQIKSAKAEAEKIVKVAHIAAQRDKQKMVEEAKEEITQLAIDATRKLMTVEKDPYHLFVESVQQEGEVDSHDEA
ncbi:MAG: ATP synthase F0 subunit B [Bacillota bacterium]|nr:ATP synthase F0 subunit B [Bacillota bacterium]